jgi:hypothetical protein
MQFMEDGAYDDFRLEASYVLLRAIVSGTRGIDCGGGSGGERGGGNFGHIRFGYVFLANSLLVVYPDGACGDWGIE